MANLATQAPRFSQSFFSDRPAHFRSWALAVVLLAATIFLLRLGDRSFWGSESRWGEITREMQLTGNYFWPTINGEVYYDKPLLSYWLIAATAYLTGALNELTVRLPSAMAGLLGVALLMVLTRQIYDDQTAVLAGCILATSYSYVFWSRVASADIENTTGVLAALTLYFRNQERPNGWWVIGLWLIMALTSLTKGLLGFVLPLLVIGSYSLLAGGWRQLHWNLHREHDLRPADTKISPRAIESVARLVGYGKPLVLQLQDAVGNGRRGVCLCIALRHFCCADGLQYRAVYGCA